MSLPHSCRTSAIAYKITFLPNICRHDTQTTDKVSLNIIIVYLAYIFAAEYNIMLISFLLGKLCAARKKARGLEKLQSATKTLKRKLEVSYEVTLSSDEDDNTIKDINLYNGMMTELKEKFLSSQSYQERVQILTLSPFTIQRTMEEFGATNYLVKKKPSGKKKNMVSLDCATKVRGNPYPMRLKMI